MSRLVSNQCPAVCRFLSPLPAKSPGINACGISPVHGLFGCAGEDGLLECFDLRSRTSIGSLNAAAAAGAVSTLPVPVQGACREGEEGGKGMVGPPKGIACPLAGVL